MKPLLFLVTLAIFFAPRVVAAQIHLCKGEWTNKPCEGVSQKTLDEVSQGADDQQRALLSEKRSLIHELTMKVLKARDDFNLTFDIADVEDLCFKRQSSIDECRDKVNQSDDRLDKKISDAAAVRAQEDANKLRAERNQIEAEKPNVTVVERKNIFVVEEDRRFRHPRDFVTPPPGAGISVNTQGITAGGTSISVNATAGIPFGPPPLVPRRRFHGRVEQLPDVQQDTEHLLR